MVIKYSPIGIIHSPFKRVEGMPIQTAGAEGVQETVEIKPEYTEALKDLDGFSHIILLYHFHQRQRIKLEVNPFMDKESHGVFSTRAPSRPNSIGISVVKLNRIEGTTLHIENVDILDGTPLLDIKPYVPEFDVHQADRIGWLERAAGNVKVKRADKRFKD
jgi:tRNA-Thr(GGU) m(6)t(6)A37 methyltransferase TsaA